MDIESVRVMMDSETVRVTPSEKTKLYLSKKLNEIEQKIKKTEKKKKSITNFCGYSG